MEFNFNDKNILVTGASKGIGRQLALSLIKSGAEVYALDVEESGLQSLSGEYGDKVHPITVDLADWGATRTALERLPAMDGLVNNAAISGFDIDALEATKDDITQAFNINFFGALNVAQVVAKKMIAEGKAGSIVNVSSIAGLLAARVGFGYSLAKTALDMMSKRLALELGQHKIRVNSISPTFVNTDMAESFKTVFPEKYIKICDHTPLGRFAEIPEVVAPVMYLLSNASSMVTGTIHVVDGGCTSNIGI